MLFRPHSTPPLDLSTLSVQRTLADVPANTRCEIKDIDPALVDPEFLMRLGLVPGVEVSIQKAGDPAIISFLGTRFALQANLLRAIVIEAIGTAQSSRGSSHPPLNQEHEL